MSTAEFVESSLPTPNLTVRRIVGAGGADALLITWDVVYFSQLELTLEMIGTGYPPALLMSGWPGPGPYVFGVPTFSYPVASIPGPYTIVTKSYLTVPCLLTATFLFVRDLTKRTVTATIGGTS